MKRLYLIRHGATDWTDAGRLCGWSDIPLNEGGREQAKALRPQVADVSAAGVWTSDFKRAAETAEIAGLDATQVEDLREINFGDLEGVVWAELEDSWRDSMIDFDNFSAPGGESVPELKARVLGFLDGLEAGNHIVVSHGGVIRMLLRMCGDDRRLLAPCEVVDVEWLPEISPGG